MRWLQWFKSVRVLCAGGLRSGLNTMAGNRQPQFCWGWGHPSEMNMSLLTLMIRKHMLEVSSRAMEKSPIINQLGGSNLHHRARWDELAPCKHPLSPDSQVKALRNTAKRTRKITKQWGFYHSCLWTVQHYVCDAQFWALGRERHVPSLCHLGFPVSPSYLWACISMQSFADDCKPFCHSFCHWACQGLFICLNYIKVPISPTSYWPRYNLS